MIDTTPVTRAALYHKCAAAEFPLDSESIQSDSYVRIPIPWLVATFVPWINANRKQPRPQSYRCTHFVHWLIEAFTNSAYEANTEHPPACARATLTLHSRDAHAVVVLLGEDDELYVLDPQDPKLVPIAAYPALSWGRIRFL